MWFIVIYIFVVTEADYLDVDLRGSFSLLDNEKSGNLDSYLSGYDRLSI